MMPEAEGWFSTVLKSIGDAVIATDAKGRIVFMNRVAEELTGWAAAEAQGQHIPEVFQLIDERTGKREVWPALEALASGTPSWC
jgi:PAS domain S-box-containing protein